MSQPLAVLCTDIDECNGTNPCAPNGNCVNTNGSFTCNCSSGYELDTGGQSCSGKFTHIPVVSIP
ncbi:MAG: calcium-binding EGF-like domain-containing protein [Alphaproteobacteria bacterium]|nr:calcium-binding EGF-like domain-containing protein [Alphaproteobacteria bacterium]